MASNPQGAMRGLSLFIGDIRNCQTKEQEEKIVYKEMAKIRSKFQNKALAGYDRKKYVWKLIYAHILGYDVDFGHEESLNLINAAKFSEKCTGYIATGIMLNEKSDQKLFERVINAIKVDLTSRNEYCEALALSTIGNIGSLELTQELSDIVVTKAFDDSQFNYTRKRSFLVVLSFLKRNRAIFNQDRWVNGFKRVLSNNTNYGVLLSCCAAIQGTIQIMGRQGFEILVPLLIQIQVDINKNAKDYFYYMTPCPWLQIKIFKILQLFPPPENQSDLTRINEIMLEIVNKTEVTKNVNKNNSDHSILFEAINLIIHYKAAAFEVLRKDIVKLLGKFISVKEPNIRYLALETMSKLSGLGNTSSLIKEHLSTILVSLRDPDISIRRRALDLLFCLCDQSVAGDVVNELLDYLQENDFELKEEMVLKIAILAEKFAENLNWYIDVIIKLIEYAGDYVAEDIWYRVAQIITGFGEADPNYTLQKYAAIKMFDILSLPSLHETMIKIGAYVLSEFGNQISDQPGKSIQKQFELIHRHFYEVGQSARGMLMTAYMKMIKYCPALKTQVVPILEQYKDYWDEDLQQRVCEYLAMLELASSDPSAQEAIFEALDLMPNFNDALQTNSILTRRIMKLKIEKGFTINQEEAEKNLTQGMKQYETHVSSALSKHQPDLLGSMGVQLVDFGGDQPKSSQMKQNFKSNNTPALDDLLGLGDSSQPKSGSPMDLLGSLNDLQPSLLGGDANEVQNHKFYFSHADRFSPQQTAKLGPQTLDNKCSNAIQWKNMLPFSMKEGLIYSDDTIEISCQVQMMKFLERISFQFKSRTGGNISNLQVRTNSSQFMDQLDLQISPIKFSPEGVSEVIIMIMLKESLTVSPTIKVQYNDSIGNLQGAEFRAPIFNNKFAEPVDMPADIFVKTWDDFTHNKPASFQKLDTIFKNPAAGNPSVSHMEVLKKVANFFSNSMNLKVFPPEDVNNFWSVKAVGQVNFKPPSQATFPTGPADVQKPVIAPILIDAEFFQEDLNEFKVSIRSNDSKQIASSMVNFLKFYINPN